METTVKINYLKVQPGKIATKHFHYRKPDSSDSETEVSEGTWLKTQDYKAGTIFQGISFPVNNIKEAFAVLQKCKNEPMFMVQGDFIEGTDLNRMYRYARDHENGPATLCDRMLNLICFDVDGYEADLPGRDGIELFISELPSPFLEADYIYQFSASYGLTSSVNTIKCHLFFWLKTPVNNIDIRNWINEYNVEKGWKKDKHKILDPAVFTANQVIYTQQRVCTGALDPITDFIGLVTKTGELEWTPPAELLSSAEHDSSVSTTSSSVIFPSDLKTAKRISRKSGNPPYSFSDGVQAILTGYSFHDEINRMALSMMSQGMPIKVIKETIKGLMKTAKLNLTDPQRLRDWKIRFDDIDRSVESAFALVDNPAIDDLLNWLDHAPESAVLKGYASKCSKKSPTELNQIADILKERFGVGKVKFNQVIKGLKEQADKKLLFEKKKYKSEALKKQNISEIMVNDNNAMRVADQIAVILRNSTRWPPVFAHTSGLVYIRYSKLVTIRQMAKQAAMKRKGQEYLRTPVICAYKKPYHDLTARLGLDIRFINPKDKEIQCPEKIATVLALADNFEHRELTGIVISPFVQKNWQLFETNGYDAGTGLYFMIDKCIEMPLMEPEAAFNYLYNDVLAEFPFKEKIDGVVAIAAMMAVLQRPLLAQDPSGIPGFGVIAGVQSAGKTTLVNLITSAVLKTSIPSSHFSEDEEENTKYLLSLLKEGNECVLFDNIKSGTKVESESLSSAMSGESYKGRLLGLNENISVGSAVIWFVTGNNIQLSGDFATRFFPIRLNPLMDDPDKRNYHRINILDEIIEERPWILRALVSIIMAGRDAVPLKTGSRYKIWDKYIRMPLYQVCGIDVNKSIEGNKEDDTELNNRRNLIKALFEKFKDSEVTSKYIIDHSFQDDGTATNVTGELLEEILGKYSNNAKSVGRLLGKMKARAYGGLILTSVETDRSYWKIERIEMSDE
jgi:hypothetical protein